MSTPEKTTIAIPEFALVALIGASGSGKSTFARDHFLPTEVLSSDFFRALVSDDENSLDATDDAFAALHFVGARRLANMKLTAIDATNVQASARKPLIELARQHHAIPVAIVLDLPEPVCRQRNEQRPDRDLAPHVIGQQCQQLRRSLRHLKREGFRRVYVFKSAEEIAGLRIHRDKLWTDRRHESGPFDIIGDVHGCAAELRALLEKLGYAVDAPQITPPPGRKAVFLGDLADRGPDIPGVLERVMNMVEAGAALCVPGNHDTRLLRALQGRKVQRTHGLPASLDQIAERPPEFRGKVMRFIDQLVSHFVLDEGRLVVAHAGMRADLAGRASGTVREFALYGETTGETDEFGLPIRHDWAADYRGKAIVAYGHTPVPRPEWLNNTINLDTGCVFGGALTALRYPEKELVSVPAARTYADPVRPIEIPAEQPDLSAQQEHDDLLDIADVAGKRRIDTRLQPRVTVRAEHAAAALEVMSRYAADPKWLIYLPPTMSPSQTSARPDLLEHPDEAFAYFRKNGVDQAICEEKHMGSRAVVVLCRDPDAARQRFGVLEEETGICYTRTGRRFFDDRAVEAEFLARLGAAAARADLWKILDTDWLALDCELMPWSAKAQQLLQDQYAAVGTAARVSLDRTIAALESATARGTRVEALLASHRARREMVDKYTAAYRAYCWPVHSVDDLSLAPFHLLASEGEVHCDRDHSWHMETLSKLCAADSGIMRPTATRLVDLNDADSQTAAVRWWEELTARGGEGMVVKPLAFIAHGPRGLVQPAVKCRGPEYLRIIYGPEYTTPAHLSQLRQRGLKAKRSLALREFALGIEALERFVRREPLRKVHECVFGVLAMESEPVDPRL